MGGGTCSCCGCKAMDGARAHAIAMALRDDDLDGAMTLGLLDAGDALATCPECAPGCRARIAAARTARLDALAARERHRARTLRLDRRERERAERRKPAPAIDVAAASTAPTAVPAPTPALPPAAAAALARARARAAAKRE